MNCSVFFKKRKERTGIKKSVKGVATRSPTITDLARGRVFSDPTPKRMATGIMAVMADRLVIRIGRILSLAPLRMDSLRGIP